MTKDNNEKGFSLPHVVMLVAVFGLVGGASYYVYNANKNDKKTNNSQSETKKIAKESTLPADLTGLKTADEIRTIAASSLGSATIVSVELENEDTGLVFKVKLSDGKILFFDAKTGTAKTKDQVKPKEVENETEDDDSASIPSGFIAGITEAQARSTAQARLPGKTVKKIELEPENGVMVYSVRFTDDSRVDINATNGAVVNVKDKSSTSSTSPTTQTSSSSDDSSDDSSASESRGSNSGSGSN